MPRPIDDSKMWTKHVESAKFDQKLHEDALIQGYKSGTVTKQQLIEEGIWDRMKARGAGAMGAAKDLGKRVSGAAHGVAAGFTGKEGPAPQKFTQGLDAKALSIANSHMKKIEAAIAGFSNDMAKLGLDPKSMAATNPEAASALTALSGALNNLKTRLQPTGQVGTAVGKVGATPQTAPAPVSP